MNKLFSIQRQAVELGFDCCRIARSRELAEQRTYLSGWLTAGRHGGLEYMQRNLEKRLDPEQLHEGTRSIIVCGIGYKRSETANPVLSRIASYAWGRDYHLVIREKLEKLMKIVQQAYPGSSGRIFVDSAPLLEKAWAVEAGLGWVGRNTLLIHPTLGSYLMLGTILTDAELPPDARYLGNCGSCRRCIEACPTGALGEDGMLDAGRCISRRTIEDCAPGQEGELHGWIFGCDLCQRACPRNRHAPLGAHPEFAPLPELSKMTPSDWLALDEQRFKERFGESPLERCGLSRLQHRIRRLQNEL